MLPHGAGTKPALSAPGDAPAATRIDLRGLSGITDYQPGEFVITALAGTPVAELQEALAQQGQYLPFDPPLASSGATVGGTLASGINGPCRLRYGGLRDFVIGVQFVDGESRLVKAGGKVIKNVAGFDYPKLLVGSFGRLGIITEITFKVFPAPETFLSLRFDLGHIDAAIEAAGLLASSPLEPHAIDIRPPGQLYLRLGGAAAGLRSTAARAVTMIDGPAEELEGEEEPRYWDEVRDFTWASAPLLVKIPVALRTLSDLDFAFGRIDARRRYSQAGNVAHAELDPGQMASIEPELESLGLCGLVLRGGARRARIGRLPSPEAEARVKRALDPSNKFLPLP